MNWIYKCKNCNSDFTDHRLFSSDVTICCPVCGFISKIQHGFEIIESPDPEKYFWPKKDEVDKLVEDHCEPSEEINPLCRKRTQKFQNPKLIMCSTPLRDETKSLFFRQFMDDKISCDDVSWENSDMGKIPDVNYPVRHSFKKRKFSLRKIIDKVVLWWRS